MNCPSRTDEPPRDAGWNQNPSGLSPDLTTRQDFNGIVNLRTRRNSKKEDDPETRNEDEVIQYQASPANDGVPPAVGDGAKSDSRRHLSMSGSTAVSSSTGPRRRSGFPHGVPEILVNVRGILAKFSKFVGPGFIISVAYIDPGNYATDVAAGAATRFKLLFIVLMSNIFAIVLQSLAVRLGTVTGMNLAEHCRAHLPRWLNIVLYILGESAIIATDIAEVIGSAIALNLLFKIPLVAGCAITLVDVLVILIFYSPTGSMRRIRAFEYFVMALVLGVVVCFCIQLSLISSDTTVGSVFEGYLPSSTVVRGQGIYLSCGILGATVMPHSLYLGSGMVQARLQEYDISVGRVPSNIRKESEKLPPYQPSLAAIRHCLNYSTAEVAISLFTFALFVNSAILITAGASLYNPSNPSETDSLFSIHDLLSSTLAPAAGTIFALALFLSGTSAGIVCTIAGQMLSEGALNWTIKPWMRRLLTRSVSITPSIIIAGAVGKRGLSATLNATQVALSVVLPFISAPLIYFTCRNKYMVVGGHRTHDRVLPTSMPGTANPDIQTGRNSSSNTEPENASPNDLALRPVRTPRSRSQDSDLANTNRHRHPNHNHQHESESAWPSALTAAETGAASATGLLEEPVKMRNHVLVSIFAVLIWLVIAIMNVSLLVLVGLGKT